MESYNVTSGTQSAGHTPIYKQYLAIRAQYPKAIIAFRLGDFYELFGQDAEIADKVANLVMTSRNISKTERIAMAGFPFHASEKYIAMFTAAGYTVVVVEQIGSEPINGLMPREVKRIVEPSQKPAPVAKVEPVSKAKPSTSETVTTLTQNGQDFEWYPTTAAMIAIVAKGISVDTHSILDVGAGDGRVLKGLSEKCPHAKLYSIELSQILIQAQPADVIPIGTDIFEQNLACLPVDYIFCNPPYSAYEEWVCKIIAEGYAQKAFMVIPQRWAESKLIADALKKRGATTRVIHTDDFHNAERQARAVVDVVEVSYPMKDHRYNEVKDPFDIWFDQNIDTFDHAEEFKESETGADLARQYAHSSIDEIVAAYRDEYKLLENNYRAIFKLDYAILKELGIDKNHVRDGLKKKMSGLKIKYWQILFNRLDAITSRLSTKSRKILLEKLTANTSVEFTVSNAYAVVLWAIKNSRQYFDDQLIELFRALSTFENALKYKSNAKTWQKDGWRYLFRDNDERRPTHYSLDYRIVVEQYRAMWGADDSYRHWDYPGNLANGCHDLIADVIAVLSNLGFSTPSLKSTDREWDGGKWQDWYTPGHDEILFQVKAYKNGNLHFRFKPEAIKALNIEAGRLLKWVRSAEEVVQEMGYTVKEAEQYFNSNAYMLSNVKLLGAVTGEKQIEEPKPASAPAKTPKAKAAKVSACEQKISTGDFIKSSTAGACCGIVARAGTVAGGQLPGYFIEKAKGKQDFIAESEAVLVCADIPEDTVQPTAPGVRVELNKSNVWLFFTTCPDRTVIAELKAAGMRWAPSKKGWYVRAWSPAVPASVVEAFFNAPTLEAALESGYIEHVYQD